MFLFFPSFFLFNYLQESLSMLYRVLKSIIHNTCRLRLVIVALRESEPKTAPNGHSRFFLTSFLKHFFPRCFSSVFFPPFQFFNIQCSMTHATNCTHSHSRAFLSPLDPFSFLDKNFRITGERELLVTATDDESGLKSKNRRIRRMTYKGNYLIERNLISSS